MSIAAIKALIDSAIAHEQRSGELRAHFSGQLGALRESLVLPPENPLQALVEFTQRYILYVPDFLESLHKKQSESTLAFFGPFLNMAEDFFLAPPQPLQDDHGLQALLDEAFLAQRLLEEMNDRHIRLQRSQLMPVDMTRANIIVHHLLGDELANQLDAIVAQSIHAMIDRQRFGSQDNGIDPLAAVLECPLPLPCMSRDVAIDLRLAER